ncbi:hypothetical protein ACA910_020415 [Epithemia clementina (nom. ined.)]
MSSIISREEAGRRAQALMIGDDRTPQQHEQQQQEPPHQTTGQDNGSSSTTTNIMKSMDTHLAHAGIRRILPMENGNHFLSSSSSLSWLVPSNTALSPPLHMATTYERAADGVYQVPPHGCHAVYARCDNPTRRLFEEEMAKLECHGPPLPLLRDSLSTPVGANDASTATASTANAVCCAFASGMMAASAIVLAHATPLHVLIPKDLYHGVPTVLHTVFARFNVTTHVYDGTALENELQSLECVLDSIPALTTTTEQQEKPDVILWMETPSNPLTMVLDIVGLCCRAKTNYARITTVVDSTLAPPCIQQPLRLQSADGVAVVDIVMHSATKYLAGHSDVTAGIVTCSPWTTRGQELGPAVQQVQVCMGGVASPMDCWLALRGLRTLQVRVERQCHNALQMAKFLEQQQQEQQQEGGGRFIAAVHYPGLRRISNAPQERVVQQQMKNELYGGVLSLEMTCEAAAFALAGALQVITRATSLGGTETLIEHRASIEPPGRVVSPPGLLRISAGLEQDQDLIQDLRQALTIVAQII